MKEPGNLDGIAQTAASELHIWAFQKAEHPLLKNQLFKLHTYV